MARWLLRKGKSLKCIIYDPEIVATLKWVFIPPDYEITFEGKVTRLQQPKEVASPSHFPSVPREPDSPGVEESFVFDFARATRSERKCAINVSYSVRHTTRHYIAHHPTHGVCTGETLDHPTGGAWFYRKLRKVWPAYILKK